MKIKYRRTGKGRGLRIYAKIPKRYIMAVENEHGLPVVAVHVGNGEFLVYGKTKINVIT